MESPSPLPVIDYGERTHPGRDPHKQVNEDAAGHWETRFGHLCVVCDGMGGHTGGREASELALATVAEMFERAPDGAAPPDVLRTAIEHANRRVHALRTSEIGFGHPGSTIVAALMHANGTEIAHVGDSRAYHVHEGRIARLTRDHSIVQELVDRGLLSAEQAAHHPDANRITRALGIAPEVEVELRPSAVAHVAGDAFVLCSDGLSDLVEDDEILAIVGDEPAAQAVGKLVDLANARGGHDNITVLVLRSRESAVMQAAPAPTRAATVPPTLPQSLVTPTVPAPSVRPPPVASVAPVAPAAEGTITAPLRAVSPPVAPAVAPADPGGARRPPQTVIDSRRPNGARPVVAVVALGLAFTALLLAGAIALVRALTARSAGVRPESSAAAPEPPVPVRAATPLTPERVELPDAVAPVAEPIAPLEPTTPASAAAPAKKHRHRPPGIE